MGLGGVDESDKFGFRILNYFIKILHWAGNHSIFEIQVF